ncbi:MAG TPA: NUDIX hydrolase [Actinomycetota bacterium]|nr:NUDIX hydrolase [Actinomycetota bacterium]
MAAGAEGGRAREAFRGRRFRVEVLERPDGAYEVARSPRAAAVVAIRPDGRVLLVRHDRPAIGGELLELPAGLVDEGEDPAACAERELLEETGHRARGPLRPLGGFYSSAGLTDERFELFLAEAEARPSGEPEAEIAEVLAVPLEEAIAWARAGRLGDAKTALGLLLAATAAGAGAR